MNRGVEIASEIADGPQSVIQEQVEMGVAVRMAVMEALLDPRRNAEGAPHEASAVPECAHGRSLARHRRASAACWSTMADRRCRQGGAEPGRAWGAEIVDCAGKTVLPGLVDARVFIGEPGGEHRETIASASLAAAAGGVTSMVMMPDTDPVIDNVALVEFMLRTARDTAMVNVYPAAAITKGFDGREMTEFGLLREAGAVALTEGRHTIASPLVMRRALTYARDFGAVIAHETEDSDLAAGGVMNEGLYASWLGLSGIPREAETIPLERDLALARLTGGAYHAAKVSTAASAAAIRS